MGGQKCHEIPNVGSNAIEKQSGVQEQGLDFSLFRNDDRKSLVGDVKYIPYLRIDKGRFPDTLSRSYMHKKIFLEDNRMLNHDNTVLWGSRGWKQLL